MGVLALMVVDLLAGCSSLLARKRAARPPLRLSSVELTQP